MPGAQGNERLQEGMAGQAPEVISDQVRVLGSLGPWVLGSGETAGVAELSRSLMFFDSNFAGRR